MKSMDGYQSNTIKAKYQYLSATQMQEPKATNMGYFPTTTALYLIFTQKFWKVKSNCF